MKRNEIAHFRCTSDLKRLIKQISKLEKKTESSFLENKIVDCLNGHGNGAIVDIQKLKDVQHAWLSPEGDLQIVPELGHCSYGEKIGCCPSSGVKCNLIARDKWCALGYGNWVFPKEITKAQLNFISAWCQANGKQLPVDLPRVKNANLRSN